VPLLAACLPLTEAAPLLPVADLLRRAYDIDGGSWMGAALERCPDFVAPAICPMRISGLLPAKVPLLWCSETQ